MSREKQNTTSTTTLTVKKRSHFAQLANEAKSLEKEINRLVASFEKKNNLTCHTIPTKRNSIELVISADFNAL